MSQRTVLVLLVIFIVVSGLYFWSAQKGHEGAKSLLTPLGKKAWLSADEIEVYFKAPRQGFKLLQKNGKWIIEDDYPRPAKEGLVNKLLQDLATLSGEKRAQGAKYFSRFKLKDDQALHLILKKDGKVLAHILLGKRGPQWESNFLRFQNDPKIYLVSQNFLTKFEIWNEEPEAPKFKAFVDLKLLDLSPKDLKLLSLKKENEAWTLRKEKEGYVWQKGSEEKKLTEEKVSSFLQKALPLFAKEIVNPQQFRETKGELRYETNLGAQGSLLLGPCMAEETPAGKAKSKKDKSEKASKKESFCLVKKGPFVYKVSQEKLKRLLEPDFAS